MSQDRIELLLLILTVCAVVGTGLWLFEMLVSLFNFIVHRSHGRHRNNRKARRAARSDSSHKSSVRHP